MGIFDRFKHRAQDKAKEPSDTAEREVDERTGGKYESQGDQAQRKAEGMLGMDRDRDRPEQP